MSVKVVDDEMLADQLDEAEEKFKKEVDSVAE
jgi:hypothetical protein